RPDVLVTDGLCFPLVPSLVHAVRALADASGAAAPPGHVLLIHHLRSWENVKARGPAPSEASNVEREACFERGNNVEREACFERGNNVEREACFERGNHDGAPPPRPGDGAVRRWVERLERAALASADHLVCTSHHSRGRLRHHVTAG